LSHAACFGDKATQEQAAKAAKTKGSSTLSKPSVSMSLIGSSPWIPPTSKFTNIASASTPPPADQKVDNKLQGGMGTEDKEVVVDHSKPDKKLRISDNLDPK
jgi:hypothetical protein